MTRTTALATVLKMVGGHWVSLGNPLIHIKKAAIVPPFPWYRHMNLPKLIQEPLHILTKSVSLQDLHAPRLVQRVIGLIYMPRTIVPVIT